MYRLSQLSTLKMYVGLVPGASELVRKMSLAPITSQILTELKQFPFAFESFVPSFPDTGNY